MKIKIQDVLVLLYNSNNIVGMCEVVIPGNIKKHHAIIRLRADLEPQDVIKYLLENNFDRESIMLITDMSHIVSDFMDYDASDVVNINTNLDGMVFITDNRSFLSYKNTADISFDEGVIKYNTGSHQAPEIETFDLNVKDHPLFKIIGEHSTFLAYKLNPFWEVKYKKY